MLSLSAGTGSSLLRNILLETHRVYGMENFMLKQEWHSLFHNRFLLLIIAAILMIPTIYTTLFLGSMWDPYGNLSKLPIAVVNQDEAASYQGTALTIGDSVVDSLKQNDSLDFHFVDAAAASAGLSDGTYYMVITIPKDFSANAATLLTDQPRNMQLDYATNPGTNYIASKMSESAAAKIKTSIANDVTSVYLQAITEQFATLGDGLQSAADGASRLSDGTLSAGEGAATLSDHLKTLSESTLQFRNGADTFVTGLAAYTDGVSRIYDGTAQLQNGVTQLTGKLPELSSGVTQLQSGAASLSDGMNNLQTGLNAYVTGTTTLADGVTAYLTATDQLRAGASQLSGLGNLGQVSDGITALQSAVTVSSDGAPSLQAGAASLAGGMSDLSGAISLLQQQAQASGNDAMSASLAALYQNALQLTQGASQLSDATSQLAGGLTQLQAATASFPDAAAGVNALNAGFDQLAQNNDALLNGASQLKQNSSALTDGASQLVTGSQSLKNGIDSLASGVSLLNSKSTVLVDGVNALYEGSSALAAQNDALTGGASQLADGASQLADGSGQLYDGSRTLTDGLTALQDGSALLDQSLADGADKIQSANLTDTAVDYLVSPVADNETRMNDIPNNGHGMAPYMMSVALWVGALAFCLMYPLTKYHGKLTSGLAWWAGKASVLYIVALLQAFVMVLFLHLINGFAPANLGQTLLVAALASVTFTSLMYFFNVILGKAGSFLMLIFMIVQLAGSAGTYPVELSGSFVAKIHDYLPFSYTVTAFRRSISGAALAFNDLWFLIVVFFVSTLGTIAVFYIRTSRIRKCQPLFLDFLKEKGLA